MTIINGYGEVPKVEVNDLPNGGASVSVCDGDTSIALSFARKADLFKFVNSVQRAAANIEGKVPFSKWPPSFPNVCSVCGFNVELVGHSVECPLHESQVSNG